MPRPSRPLVLVLLAALVTLGVAPGGVRAADVVPLAETGTLSLFKRIENLDSGASEGRRELWTMHAVNTVTGEEITGDGLNGVQSRTVPAGSYVISESGGVPGYRFQDWTCDGVEITDPTPTVTVAPGQTVTCTVDNEAIEPSLTLVKEVVGGSASPADWTLRAQGPSSIAGASGTDDVTGQRVRIGDYTLSEEGGPQGYVPGGWTCTATDASGAVVDVPLTGDVVSIGLDRAVVCTVTNTAQLPHLTLVKQVDNTGGGRATPDAWQLAADGPVDVAGPGGSAAVTSVPVVTGEYRLSESGGPPGYADGAWSCTGQSGFSGDVVAVGPDDDVVCTVTNTWAGGLLTLEKVVDGGSAPPAAWTLVAQGTGDVASVAVSGATGDPAVTAAPLPPGTYTLAEQDGPTGYTPGGWVCDGVPVAGTVTVVAGQTSTCTVTNTWVPPHLTLVKEVVTTGGGTAVPQDWTLSASGPTPGLSGPSGSLAVSHVTVAPGQYTLAESGGPDGYAPGAWECTGATAQAGATVTVDPGQDVVCTVTNTWTGGTLTLVKAVDASNGGTATPQEWLLAAESSAATLRGASGSPEVTAVPVPAGEYALLETGGPDGYTSLGWACTGGTLAAGDRVTVAQGADVVCTVTNRGVAPRLTLVKDVVTDGGGTAVAQDWTLLARGEGDTALAGTSGSGAVTAVPVPAETYALAETGGPPGYAASAWSCEGAAAQTATTVTLAPGQDAVCTVTNTWTGGLLTLVKEVDNSLGGTATPQDWTLAATGGQAVVSGTSGTPDVTAVPVPAGAYALGESGSREGYDAGAWTCTGGEVVEDVVTVPSLGTVVCTVVNTSQGFPVDPTPPPTPGPTPVPTPAPTVAPAPDDPGTGAGPDDGALATTGGDLAASLLPAVVLVLVGASLLLLRRRRL